MEKSSRRIWLSAGIAALLLLAAGLIAFFAFHKGPPRDQPGNLIVNGSFERPEVPPMPKNADKKARRDLWTWGDPEEMKPWETDLNNFEIWANGFVMPRGNATVPISPIQSADGQQNIEIISDAEMKGAVWQTVKTSPGKHYTFSFFHSPRPGAHTTLTVLVDENAIVTLPEDGTPYGTLHWQQFTTNLVADGAMMTVKFSDETDVLGQGTHLDGVMLKAE
jgi:hypothetical protein